MKVFLALLILLAAASANAGSATQFFKDQQATLFDLGMFRLELSVSQSHEYVSSLYKHHAQADRTLGGASASYSVRDDMIRIGVSFMDEQSTDEQMEAGCREVLRMMRINVSKSVWRMFTHYGEERDPEIQPMIQDLYDRIVLRCYVSGNDSSEGRFYASMPLKGDLGEMEGFKIGKWRMDNE